MWPATLSVDLYRFPPIAFDPWTRHPLQLGMDVDFLNLAVAAE